MPNAIDTWVVSKLFRSDSVDCTSICLIWFVIVNLTISTLLHYNWARVHSAPAIEQAFR